MSARASESIEPQDGFGGWMPMPRKLSVASVRIAPDSASVTCTVNGATTFGEIWRTRMGQVFTPTLLAFLTYSRPLAEMTAARTVRQNTGILTMPMATIVGPMPLPSTAEMNMASRMDGKANSTSITHMMTRSTTPSK